MRTRRQVTIHTDELLAPLGDFTERMYTATVVDSALVGTPEEASASQTITLSVKISRSLQRTWKLKENDLRAVMFEFGKRFLSDSVASGDCSPSIHIDLNTSTAPAECPYDPRRVVLSLGEPFHVETSRPLGFRLKG